jgi:hypothetical protein
MPEGGPEARLPNGRWPLNELEDTLNDSLAGLHEVVAAVKPPDAWRRFSDLTVEQFWQNWPEIRGWGEWMWTLINNEREEKAAPVSDPDLDESGSSG